MNLLKMNTDYYHFRMCRGGGKQCHCCRRFHSFVRFCLASHILRPVLARFVVPADIYNCNFFLNINNK